MFKGIFCKEYGSIAGKRLSLESASIPKGAGAVTCHPQNVGPPEARELSNPVLTSVRS